VNAETTIDNSGTAPGQAASSQDPLSQDPLSQDPLLQDPLLQDPLSQDPLSLDPLSQDPLSEYPLSEYALWGRGLRMILVDELRRRADMTVAELVTVIHGHGFSLGGRASKVISDALRWEVAAGRVQRLSRGVYRYPPSVRLS
jgi:hypothetical protein